VFCIPLCEWGWTVQELSETGELMWNKVNLCGTYGLVYPSVSCGKARVFSQKLDVFYGL
jgi:hypothetical protein